MVTQVEGETRPLQLRNTPVALTFAAIDDYVRLLLDCPSSCSSFSSSSCSSSSSQVIADPAIDEERLQAGAVTMVVDERGALCALLKPGGVALSEATLQECLVKAKGRVLSALKKVDKALAAATATAL